jgi:hypothetical protein
MVTTQVMNQHRPTILRITLTCDVHHRANVHRVRSCIQCGVDATIQNKPITLS